MMKKKIIKKNLDKQQTNKFQASQQQSIAQDMLISRLQIKNNVLNQQIKTLHSSLSWKITRPLRTTLHFIASLKQTLVFKIQSRFFNQLLPQLRKLLLKIYQISWIKKRVLTFLDHFPVLQQRIIGIMHKKNSYLNNPYYNNDNITNSSYLPKTARHIYSELISNKTVN